MWVELYYQLHYAVIVSVSVGFCFMVWLLCTIQLFYVVVSFVDAAKLVCYCFIRWILVKDSNLLWRCLVCVVVLTFALNY